MDVIWKFLATCHTNSFYPEVIVFALGAYFTVRWWFDVGPKRSQWSPVAAAFIGMIYFIRPIDVDTAIRFFFLSALHAFFAVGGYSWADKRGWVDKVGDIVDQKLFGNKPKPIATESAENTESKIGNGQAGKIEINALINWTLVGLSLFSICMWILFISSGCKTASVIAPHVVETQTVAQEPVQQVQPIADAPKTDVPVDVKPSDVIAIVEQPQPNGEVEKTWIVLEPAPIHIGKPKIKVYQNKTASAPVGRGERPFAPAMQPQPVTVHTIKPSHTWCIVTIASVVMIIGFIISFGLMRGFFQLNNPVGWISGGWSLLKFIWGLIKSLRGGKA